MKKHFSQLLTVLAFALGLYLLVNGFSFNFGRAGMNDSAADTDTHTEQTNDRKVQTGINISSISKHILDFSK